MIGGEQFKSSFSRTLRIIEAQANGVTHEQALLQPPMRGNCMNWVLGHALNSRNRVLGWLGAEPVLAENLARYRRESEPVTGEAEGVLRLEALLDGWRLAQERTAAALDGLTPEELASPRPFFDREVPLDQALLFQYFHETYHIGQLELLRQLTGVNDHVI